MEEKIDIYNTPKSAVVGRLRKVISNWLFSISAKGIKVRKPNKKEVLVIRKGVCRLKSSLETMVKAVQVMLDAKINRFPTRFSLGNNPLSKSGCAMAMLKPVRAIKRPNFSRFVIFSFRKIAPATIIKIGAVAIIKAASRAVVFSSPKNMRDNVVVDPSNAIRRSRGRSFHWIGCFLR